MGEQQVYQGTPDQLAEQLRSLPDTQNYRMTLIPEEATEEDILSLEAAITRMIHRTPQEVAAVRERLLGVTPPPRELPEDMTIFDVVMGKWPGDETDDQIATALEKLS
jgi:hypothetical protein